MSLFRRTALPLTALVAAVVVTGCSYSLSYEQHRQIHMLDTISFSWWGGEIRSDYTLKGIDNFEQINSSIDVRPYSSAYGGYKDNLDTLMRSGIEYDVMQIDSAWLEEYSPDGNGFYDLYELSDIIQMGNFSSNELSCGEINGRLNGIPISFDSLAFCYNKQIFTDRELDLPKTWDELISCAYKLSRENITLLEAPDNAKWLVLIAYEEQLTGKRAFFDRDNPDDGCFGIGEVMDMIETESRLIDAGVLSEDGFSSEDFIEGRSAGEVIFISDIGKLAKPIENVSVRLAVGKTPRMETAKRGGWYITPSGFYAISRNTDKPEAAAMFLDYLLNDSYMTALQGTEKGVPVSRSALETLDGTDQLNGAVYDAATMMKENGDPPFMDKRALEADRYEEFFRLCALCRAGGLTVEQAAQNFLASYPFS